MQKLKKEVKKNNKRLINHCYRKKKQKHIDNDLNKTTTQQNTALS